ncbi:coproporphyrinogen dehydrogenase HemZ [Eubacteriaceae bacterium ES3]|nr:coproporphyrinogen dehydrogenase HemZ [Eubacteriaceae bacterium ES3]
MSILLFNLENPDLEYYFHEMVQAFEPGIKNVWEGDWDGKLTQSIKGLEIEYQLEWKEKQNFAKKYSVSSQQDLEDKGIYKGYLYDFLSEYYQKELMWGSLTGIKPVKIVQKLQRQGLTETLIKKKLMDYYRVSDDRTQLLLELAKKQREIIEEGKKKISIYIGIPLCPSKCSYCSFVSTIVDRKRQNLNQYFANLLIEIEEIGKLIKEKNITVDSIYIGGGTPTVLTANQLDELFLMLDKTFALNQLREFTLEAGRTDTLSDEKLMIAKKFGVDRICLNPQSMNQKTLDTVKRPCSATDISHFAEMVRFLKFENLNMDLIIGLGEEKSDDFLNSLNQVLDFQPENITIHNLSVKKGSKIKNDFGIKVNEGYGESFYQQVRKILLSHGYNPYYLYRLKYTCGNSENVGYSLKNKEGIYNIMMMSETQTVIGIGAGATGNIYDEERDEIKKIFTVKDVKTYNDRFYDILDKKKTIIKELLKVK